MYCDPVSVTLLRVQCARDFQLFVCQEAFSLALSLLPALPVLRFNLGRNADSNRASSRASWPGAGGLASQLPPRPSAVMMITLLTVLNSSSAY